MKAEKDECMFDGKFDDDIHRWIIDQLVFEIGDPCVSVHG